MGGSLKNDTKGELIIDCSINLTKSQNKQFITILHTLRYPSVVDILTENNKRIVKSRSRRHI